MVRSALSTRALTGLRRLWAINASPCALAATSSGGATSQALMQPPCSSRTTLPVPLHYQALHGIHTTGSSGQGATSVSDSPDGQRMDLEIGRLAPLADGSCVARMGDTQTYSPIKKSYTGATSVSDLPGGRRIELEIGRLAPLADGSCVARMGDTHVLATVVCSSEVDPEVDGMPLQVDFAEGAHTMARIPISGTRREPRPGGSDKEVLGARAIDRALRPLFLPGFLYEIHCGDDGELPGLLSLRHTLDTIHESPSLRYLAAALSKSADSQNLPIVEALLYDQGLQVKLAMADHPLEALVLRILGHQHQAWDSPHLTRPVRCNRMANLHWLLWEATLPALNGPVSELAKWANNDVKQKCLGFTTHLLFVFMANIEGHMQSMKNHPSAARLFVERAASTDDLETEFSLVVCATVLSIERHVPHADVLAINAASAALLCSDIPWGGPVGAVRVGLDSDGHPVLFPTQQQIVDGGMNLMYAGTSDKAMMVELQANQISEELLVQAMEMAQGAVETIVLSQQRQAKAVGRKKRVATLYNLPQHLEDKVESLLAPKLEELLRQQRLLKSSHESGQGPDSSKHERSAAIQRVKGIGASQLKKEGLWATEDKPDGLSDGSYSLAFDSALSGVMRKMALEEGVRIDGRGLTDVRSLACEVGNQEDVLEERKGAADFKPQHFFLHYRFPPFSVNEVGKLGAPNRREIGHGALAEKALAPLMPLVDQFPFPVRLFVDTLASNGSSSMAAVCAGSLAMRCAGVPTSDQAAGISMGLLTEWGGKQSGYKMKAGGTNPGEPCWSWPSSYGRHKLITDVQGAEDQLGDMDFKVAGTRKGITALQLDIKLPGVLADALHPARVARLKILDLMESEFQSKVASLPAEDRPGFEILPINKDYMRLVVAPQGKTLAEVQDRANTRLVVPLDETPMTVMLVVGPHGETLAEVQDSTNTRLVVPLDETPTTRLVVGPHGETLAEVQDSTNTRLVVPLDETPTTVRLVVGPHGETLAEIQDSTNTRLVVPEVPDTDDCNVHVYAPNSASMNAAKSRMAEIEGTDMVEGKIYRAKVVAVQDIGALLEMDNGTRHYLHLGEVAHTK
eukprot:gene13418-19271_t